jgi:uncharacterized protein
MSITLPLTSSNSIWSPILIGWATASWTPAIMLPIVCWAAKPRIAASRAVEAKSPAASFSSSVNWAIAIAATIRNTTRKRRRRRKRSRVFVERETWETAGDMEAKLPTAAPPEAIPGKPEFPYTNWGPWLALLGVLMALGTAIVFSVPIAIVDNPGAGEDLSGAALALAQLGQELSFLLVPFALAASKGATVAESMRRLGLVAFRRLNALQWMGAAIGIYLVFVMVYVALVGEPEQDDFADDLGPLWIQILLISIAAPIGEEVCFRGMLFGGLRERLPMWAAGLISAVIFGLLHVTTGISVVPPLIVFGFLLALVYERTGSILPCILLHMLNNSVALLAQ